MGESASRSDGNEPDGRETEGARNKRLESWWSWLPEDRRTQLRGLTARDHPPTWCKDDAQLAAALGAGHLLLQGEWLEGDDEHARTGLVPPELAEFLDRKRQEEAKSL